ncbi:hypothetical protein SPRG_06984 [Saprolegnia parasitica CBS 223.65]|uniref:Wings apart-like protein C-terminal domain-containing protein n=1 Tax=Saprolegnia parasitica (strain CBS 223.65) TaxID=695850 RepID=A0A067CKT3_SAPPC|nr:hypothetical protein SPRG_06984 [Saprolegnia parasitica CBS 223.65]KDO27397.1 hypothetical protein SPRG_06984 [Saprolegnia parasitica CBS 223.65]|eukprot:XP_012201837.1 hypothetical protein SPRG_06984 [Saprolegnia parasitica CBS 223.65]
MQTTAHLQHHGGSTTAGEQVEYLLQGLEGGTDASCAASAYTLATMCSSHHPRQATGPAVNGAMTGRFLLRAQGGLTDCVRLIEILAPESRDHALVYCMMGLLYFVTLDRENADAVTTPALRAVLHVLQLDDAKHWTLVADATPSPTTVVTPRARMLVKKKKTTTKRASTTPRDDMEALLRLEPSFRTLPSLSLCEIVLGILYNTLLDKAESHFGVAAAPTATRVVETRKQLLREEHGLDIIARRGLSSVSLRVLDQASYLDPLNQAYLVTHTAVLPTLFQGLLIASPMADDAEQYLCALRLVINLTHKNADACTIIANLHGARALTTTFCSLVSTSSDFDLVLLLLSALINCVELDARNRADVWSDSKHLVDHCMGFLTQHGTVSAEDVVLRGSMALFLGCLVRDRPADANAVRQALPNQSFSLLLASLLAFAKLHAHIGALTPEILATCVQVETELKRLEGDKTALSAIQAAVAGPDAEVAAIYAKIAAASPPRSASPPKRPPRPSPTCPSTPPADAFRLQVHRTVEVDDDSDDLSTSRNTHRRTPTVSIGQRRPTPSPKTPMPVLEQVDDGDFAVTDADPAHRRP